MNTDASIPDGYGIRRSDDAILFSIGPAIRGKIRKIATAEGTDFDLQPKNSLLNIGINDWNRIVRPLLTPTELAALDIGSGSAALLPADWLMLPRSCANIAEYLCFVAIHRVITQSDFACIAKGAAGLVGKFKGRRFIARGDAGPIEQHFVGAARARGTPALTLTQVPQDMPREVVDLAREYVSHYKRWLVTAETAFGYSIGVDYAGDDRRFCTLWSTAPMTRRMFAPAPRTIMIKLAMDGLAKLLAWYRQGKPSLSHLPLQMSETRANAVFAFLESRGAILTETRSSPLT